MAGSAAERREPIVRANMPMLAQVVCAMMADQVVILNHFSYCILIASINRSYLADKAFLLGTLNLNDLFPDVVKVLDPRLSST